MSKPVKIRAGTTALLGIIGDEETVTGFLLAGIGDNDPKHAENFLIVSQSTPQSQIEEAFKKFTSREDIAILLINQHVAEQIRYLLDSYSQITPAILEVPSKEAPYDPSKDYILSRVKMFFSD
ncbi:predicted protein [Naegleria gruberi]|uniref:V-type proton ATPase subunit F n=1 Tax=Naegleria gruberi TaxID=5762 RepID=D2VAI5_NAEGR|nr:uncharacterized protein NAEGRDRAFT_32528 [Naegleria gruberi]EFC45962.1 predicted protein [Naegleria gruberi]|eukprot:XP_002678706.1 predicted protein [Naegleria gruberi strain NEG-M]